MDLIASPVTICKIIYGLSYHNVIFSVLHVCSVSSRTNKIVHLYADSQTLPANLEGECYCDVAISANRLSILIMYSSSVTASCGVEFKVLAYTYNCASSNVNMDDSFNRTTFRKTADIGGSVCLSISLGKFPYFSALETMN